MAISSTASNKPSGAGAAASKGGAAKAKAASRVGGKSAARTNVKPTMRIAEEFVYGLADIYSESALEQIRNTLRLLETTPLMGTTLVRSSLARRYGGTIRILPVLTLSIVYRYDAASNTTDILALIYGTAQ